MKETIHSGPEHAQRFNLNIFALSELRSTKNKFKKLRISSTLDRLPRGYFAIDITVTMTFLKMKIIEESNRILLKFDIRPELAESNIDNHLRILCETQAI